MKSETICIERYTASGPEQKFEFIYENFSIIQDMIKDFREDLITEVLEQKYYNRRRVNGNLGVRVQISMGISNPTQNQAIDHMTIAHAIDEGFLDEDFFEDTDDRYSLIKKVDCYHSVKADVETFASKLRTMNLKDQRILKPYLMKQKTMYDLTEDMGIEYRSAIKRVYRIKKRLIKKVEPKLIVVDKKENIDYGI